MIIYNPLFMLLACRGMKKTDLLKVISSGTLAKLSKNENIQTEVIDKICLFLECQPGDIMKVVTEYKETNNTATYKYHALENVDTHGNPIIGNREQFENEEMMHLFKDEV